jgi:uncharacterized protein (UPF0248 family)
MKLEKIKYADVVIGIMDLTENVSIDNVVKAISTGFARYLPELKPLIVKSGGKDSQVFLNTDPYEERELNFISGAVIPLHRILLEEENDRKEFLRQVFYMSDILNSSACVILGGDLECITPSWIETLLNPVIKSEYDFVCPFYRCHRYDCNINNNLIYPVVKGLYNISLRYPAGGDYAISIDLVRTYLEKDVWLRDDVNMDIWMINTAVGEGFEIAEAFLGPKYHDFGHSLADMENNFKNIISTVFNLMDIYKDIWSNMSDDKAKEVLRFGFSCNFMPKVACLNKEELILKGKEYFKKYDSSIKNILSEENYKKISTKKHSVDKELWARIVIDYLLYFNSSSHELIDTIIPFYLFRLATMMEESIDLSDMEFEKNLELLCNKFSEKRGYLSEKWEEN